MIPTTTITISMSGSSDRLYDALEEHNLPTRGIIESINAEKRYTVVELPDSDEIRARVKELAKTHADNLLAVIVTSLYPGTSS